MSSSTETTRIVIAGAGFGGVRAALKLAKNKQFDITVISDRATFRYYPALFATATGHAKEESTIHLKKMFLGHRNVSFTLDTVTKVDAKRKRIAGEKGGWYQYDSLILGLGMVTNYFGIKGLEEFSYGIKNEQEIAKLKEHLHGELTAEGQLDANYIVVGGGPTGVELAAALREYIQQIARHHDIPHPDAKVTLVEAQDRILPKMTPHASKITLERLESLSIRVMTESRVEGAAVDELTVDGKNIASKTIVWTSGVANSPFYAANAKQFKLAPNGKVQVDNFLQGAPSIYVIGDNAATPFSGLAQTALYDADFVARNLKRQLKKAPPKKYKPRKPPVVVPVDPKWAVVEWGPFVFGGVTGSLLRRVADLIGYYDILPLPTAVRIWLNSSKREEDCAVCNRRTVAAQSEE